jgi:hypothetical protein
MYGSPWPRVYANLSERDIRPSDDEIPRTNY